MKQINQFFADNWDEIQETLKKQWKKLSDKDITDIDGSYKKFSQKLKEVYPDKVEVLEEEIAFFLKTNGYDEMLDSSKKVAENFLAQTEHFKQVANDCIKEYFNKFKNVTTEKGEEAANYCKSNPLKVAGMLFLAGAAVATLITKIND